MLIKKQKRLFLIHHDLDHLKQKLTTKNMIDIGTGRLQTPEKNLECLLCSVALITIKK